MKKTKKIIENKEQKQSVSTSNRVGSLLKKRREEKSLSLKKVSKQLCIREDFLIAIEEGTKKNLPERVYTLGFIRSYAHFLDLDENAVLDEYIKEYKEDDLHPRYIFPEPLPQKGVPSFINYGIGFLILSLGLALWVFVKNPFVSEIPSSSSEELLIQPSNPLPSVMAPPPPPAVSPVVIPPAVDTSSHREMPPFLPISTDIISSSLDPSPNLESEISPEPESLSPQEENLSSPEDIRTPSTIRLQATEKVWIQLNNQTETPILTKTMIPGETYTLPYSEELLLTTGNAGGLKVFIDENEAPSLGHSGEVKRNIPLQTEKLLEYVP